MSRIEVLFFELLQVSIGNRRRLSEVPSAADWQLLFEMSKKQALTAVAFAGVTRLNSASDFGVSLGIDEMTYLKWLGLTAKVAQRNKKLNHDCIGVIRFFRNHNIGACILKGQGVLDYYPSDLRECRNPGDIDVWLNADKKTIFRIGKSIDKDVKGVYHHLEMDVTCKEVNGVVELSKDNSAASFSLELHYRPAFFANPIIDRRFANWVESQRENLFRNIIPFYKGSICVPTDEFNVVFMLVHCYKHFLFEGLGLRQLMDYYFVIKKICTTDEATKRRIVEAIKTYKLYRFAGSVMFVLCKVFGLREEECIVAINVKYGKRMLARFLEGGNFGHYDNENMKVSDYKSHIVRFFMRNYNSMRLLYDYPTEVLWYPFHCIRNFILIRLS